MVAVRVRVALETRLLVEPFSASFAAGPAWKVTVPPVTATGVTMDSVFTSAVVDCRLQVEMPKALVAEQGPKVLLDPLAEKVGVIPGTGLLFTSFKVIVMIEVAVPSAVTGLVPVMVEFPDAGAPATVVIFPLVPVRPPPSVPVTVWTVPATVLVVKVTVAAPLAFVVLVEEEKEPPFVLIQVTILPEVDTAFPLASVNCAVIVTCVPATGVLLLDVTLYFLAEPGLKVTVSAALPPKTALHGLVAPEHVEELRPD